MVQKRVYKTYPIDLGRFFENKILGIITLNQNRVRVPLHVARQNLSNLRLNKIESKMILKLLSEEGKIERNNSSIIIPSRSKKDAILESFEKINRGDNND